MTDQAQPVDRDSPMPLWAQLHDDLVRRLTAGGFAAGFPGEHELVDEYGVSRHTVREALRRLRQAGVLDSARGRRTAVHQQRIEQPLGALYSLFQEVQARGMRQRNEVLARDLRGDVAVAARLGLDPDTRFVHLERLRFADDEPLATDRVWLLAELARPLLTTDLTGTGIYSELARHEVRVTDGEERIHAIVPTAEQRRRLDIGRGVGLLAVERIGRADGRPVEWRETFVRGDRFSLVAGWAPHRAYQLRVADGSPLRSPAGR
ncbi:MULTISPECIES: GntR family transcriptional regulator [unclassified Micromonospora]|uniref:GntR family transcriptional regulator n=1 Tax=unclassified Micromonospora TaxID=2617518 RepID=UPI003A8A2A20